MEEQLSNPLIKLNDVLLVLLLGLGRSSLLASELLGEGLRWGNGSTSDTGKSGSTGDSGLKSAYARDREN